MRAIVQETIDYRNKHNVIRKDILQLLLQLKNTGKINTDNDKNGSLKDDDNKNWEAKVTKSILHSFFSYLQYNLMAYVSFVSFYFHLDAVDKISVDVIAAQLFLFYLAGFETTAATISFTLNEISQRSNILNLLIQDIEESLNKHEQQITYESLRDMKYLDACILGK